MYSKNVRPNPIKSLLKSRKFLLLMLDTIVSAIILIGGWYLVPTEMDKIAAVVGLLQAPFTMIIYAISSEDNSIRAKETALEIARLSGKKYTE